MKERNDTTLQWSLHNLQQVSLCYTPLSYFTREKERKEIEILLTTDTSYNSWNSKCINGFKNIQDTYPLKINGIK